MINCLSGSKFANLLFVNVQMGDSLCAGAAASVAKPDDRFAGCRYLRQAIRPTGGDRGAAGIRFSGRPRLAAGAGVPAASMK